jgi:UDP-glucose 4-epimerase
MKMGKTITIWGDGSVVRDYIHVSDLVRAYATVVKNEAPSRIYNIGTGKGANLNEIVKLLSSVSGIEPKVRYEPARGFDVPVNVLDSTRAKREFGWEPKINLEEGLKEYFEEN